MTQFSMVNCFCKVMESGLFWADKEGYMPTKSRHKSIALTVKYLVQRDGSVCLAFLVAGVAGLSFICLVTRTELPMVLP